MIRFILIFVFSIPYLALAKVNLSSPYIGFDAGIKNANFVRDYGDNLFPHKQPLINVFFGLENVVPNINLELNVDTTTRTQRIQTLTPKDLFLGEDMGGLTIPFRNYSRIYGYGINLISKFSPICCDQFKLLLGAGVKRTKIKIKVANIINDKSIKFRGNRDITARVFGGWEYTFKNNISIRGLLSWENTSKIKINGYDFDGDLYNAFLKNNTTYTLGVVYRI